MGKYMYPLYLIVLTVPFLEYGHIMSAYFSATETAFSSLNRIRIKNMAEKGNKKARLVMRLSENYDSLLSTILIGNNIVKETLIKYSTHITQSAFSADCTKILQSYLRMSRDFCAFLPENMQVSSTAKMCGQPLG